MSASNIANNPAKAITALLCLFALLFAVVPCSANLPQTAPARQAAGMPAMDCAACCSTHQSVSTPALCCAAHPQAASIQGIAIMAQPLLTLIALIPVSDLRLTYRAAQPNQTHAPPPLRSILRI